MDRFVVARKRPAPLAKDTMSATASAPMALSSSTTSAPKKKARSSETASQDIDADYPLTVHAAWLFERVPDHWKPILREACSHYTFDRVAQFLRCEIGRHHVFYPPMADLFEALHRCRITTALPACATNTKDGDINDGVPRGPADVAVVILGQDPYIHEGQAHGMAFSVRAGTPTPPSLANVFLEVYTDILAMAKPVAFAPTTGCLVGWARQGVLLLNTCLTVEEGQPGSHVGRGWEPFTDAIISAVSKRSPHPVVFMLWGRDAQGKRKLIDQNRHKILEAAHPSPKSAADGFFGCRHFTQANDFLAKHRRPRIDWTDLSLDPVSPPQQEQLNDDASRATIVEPDKDADNNGDANNDNNGNGDDNGPNNKKDGHVDSDAADEDGALSDNTVPS